MRKELEKKINQAIRLLQSIPTDKGDIELSYSGEKDSDVILKLSQLAGIKVRVIYKSTSIDPPGTISHATKNGAEIIRPKKTFFQLVEQKGLPSRFVRFCCSELKEYKVCDTAIQGIRRSESRARNDRYQEPQICRIYNKNKNQRVSVFCPYWNGRTKTLTNLLRLIISSALQCIMTKKANFMWSAVWGACVAHWHQERRGWRNFTSIREWCDCISKHVASG